MTVAALVWRLLAPASFGRWLGRPLRSWWARWFRYAPRWAALMARHDLTVLDGDALVWPGLRKVSAAGDRDALLVKLRAGQKPEDLEAASERLWSADAHPDGIDASAGDVERRERWLVGEGELTLRSTASGVTVADVRDRAPFVGMTRQNIGQVRVALVEDLLDIAVSSPWSDDRASLPGLRAVLASGRYSTREARTGTAT